MRLNAASGGLLTALCVMLFASGAHGADASRAAPYPNTSSMGGMANQNDEWYRQCMRVKDAQIPAADRLPGGAAKDLAKCDAQDLYYSARSVADWTRARHCAIAQDDPGVLMMLYANAKGVKRDYDLALRFACGTGGAPAEMSGRVAHLMSLKRDGPGKTDFDLCDDITSGMMMGVCADLAEQQKGKMRAARLQAIVGKWPQNHRIAFQSLQKAFDGYARLASDLEVDQMGTARGAFVTEAQADYAESFVKDIESFEQGRLPAYGSAEFQLQDKNLNDAYKKIMNNGEFDRDVMFGTIKKAGIRETQRAWLKYRDAWVAFGRLRYQAAPASAWLAHFTGKRLAELKVFADTH